MMLEDLIEEAHHWGLRVNNLFEPDGGTWLASVTDDKERYEVADGSSPHAALRGALDGAIARRPVGVAGTPCQKSTVALSVAPIVEVAEATGADHLAIGLAPVSVSSGSATIGSLAVLTSAPTGIAIAMPSSWGSMATATGPALQVGGASALTAEAVLGSPLAMGGGGRPGVADATDFALIPALMVGTNVAMASIFDDGTRWDDGTPWIDN